MRRSSGYGFARVVLGLLVAAAGRPAVAAYTITDLGTLGGGYSYARSINASGQVVGYSQQANETDRAFSFSGTALTDLLTGSTDPLGRPIGNGVSSANGINSAGQVVGSAIFPGDPSAYAFFYSTGKTRGLGTLGGLGSEANGINDAGQIVGTSLTVGNLGRHAFSWDSSNGMRDLNTLGGRDSYGNGINAAGHIVGSSLLFGNKTSHAFLFTTGSPRDLMTLGGTNSYAAGINASDQVVGSSQITGDGELHAFIWANDAMRDLGTLGGKNSYATAINGPGQVIGASYTASDTNPHAFLWDSSGMSDLNRLLPDGSGWELLEATAINDNGQIVGYGTHNGQPHAFRLSP
jgi:probable HAF family extracellular repeat protein